MSVHSAHPLEHLGDNVNFEMRVLSAHGVTVALILDADMVWT